MLQSSFTKYRLGDVQLAGQCACLCEEMRSTNDAAAPISRSTARSKRTKIGVEILGGGQAQLWILVVFESAYIRAKFLIERRRFCRCWQANRAWRRQNKTVRFPSWGLSALRRKQDKHIKRRAKAIIPETSLQPAEVLHTCSVKKKECAIKNKSTVRKDAVRYPEKCSCSRR